MIGARLPCCGAVSSGAVAPEPWPEEALAPASWLLRWNYAQPRRNDARYLVVVGAGAEHMKLWDVSRYALSSCAAFALLTGCGGSQPGIGAPGLMPRGLATLGQANRSGSWMVPEAKATDLLYATGGCAGTCVLSYPEGKFVGALAYAGYANCSDNNGNVFIPMQESVVELAHGGTSPIATYPLPYSPGVGCAVDPVSGDLAVVNDVFVTVFAAGTGIPTTYNSLIDPISLTEATRQTGAVVEAGELRSIVHQGKSEPLVYVSYFSGNNPGGHVNVFNYAEGTLLETLVGFNGPLGECADKDGNVFIADSGQNGTNAPQVVEYAHGGSAPIATLRLSGVSPWGCAVDPKTGNLAVTANSSTQQGVAIFKDATGAPAFYPSAITTRFCAYDANGNLFVDGQVNSMALGLVELPEGSTRFTQISLSKRLPYAGSIQWDGKFLTLSAPTGDPHGPATIYRLSIFGSNATIAHTTLLRSSHGNRNSSGAQYWIFDGTIVGPIAPQRNIGLWRYPAGGKNVRAIKSAFVPFGTVVSAVH